MLSLCRTREPQPYVLPNSLSCRRCRFRSRAIAFRRAPRRRSLWGTKYRFRQTVFRICALETFCRKRRNRLSNDSSLRLDTVNNPNSFSSACMATDLVSHHLPVSVAQTRSAKGVKTYCSKAANGNQNRFPTQTSRRRLAPSPLTLCAILSRDTSECMPEYGYAPIDLYKSHLISTRDARFRHIADCAMSISCIIPRKTEGVKHYPLRV